MKIIRDFEHDDDMTDDQKVDAAVELADALNKRAEWGIYWVSLMAVKHGTIDECDADPDGPWS